MSNEHRVNQKFYFGRPVWQNSTKTYKVHPLKYYIPENQEELVNIVQEGIDNGVRIRAVGSGHSYSKAPLGNGLLVDTSKLDEFMAYASAKVAGNYFTVGGGIKVRALNAKLDKEGYCLSAMGGIDHQSIAGAVSTGTHGSSLGFGAMSNMVRSIVLVCHDLAQSDKAAVYRIEPGAGFSDPAKVKEKLICDDEIYYSALVSFGSMGIVYSYVIEAEPMYFMKEKKCIKSWSELRASLKDGLLRRHDSVMVLINPYVEESERIALLTTHDRVPKEPTNLIMENLKRKWWYGFRRFSRSFSYELVSRIPFLFWFTVWGFNKKPENVGKLLNTAIKSQRDEEYYNKGYNVMYQGLDYIKERAYDCEFAVPVENDEYLDVLEDLIEYLQRMHEKYKVNLTSPLGLRFVGPSNALMTPESGKEVCYIDTPILLHIYGRETILDNIQTFMLAKDAIPHWGKINARMDENYVKTHYAGFTTFFANVRRFNPYQLFSNSFTRQVLDY